MDWLKWMVRAGVALALAAAAGAGWLLGTESGLRWALARVLDYAPPGLEVEEPRGALLGTVSFERLAYQGQEARRVAFELNLLALLADTISLEFLRADSVTLKRPQGSGDRPATLPFGVRVADAQIRSVTFEGY